MKRLICILLVASASLAGVSCVATRHDNGKHKGWYKNPRNPHHPLSGKKKKKKGKPRKQYKLFQESPGSFTGAYTPIN